MANIFDNYGMDYTSACNNSLREAEVGASKYVDLPEGSYQCRTFGIYLKPSKKYQDELQFRIGFEVLEGPYKGSRTSKFYAVIPEQMGIIKYDLSTLGVELDDDIRNLGDEAILESLDGLIVDLTIRHKKAKPGSRIDHFTNLFINRLVGKDTAPFEEAEDDDENPFE